MWICDRKNSKLTHTCTLSMIFWKCTSTVQLSTSLCLSELWISTESFFDLIFWALYPNTNSIESITLDFPLPFGPMMQEKRYEGEKGGETVCKYSKINRENFVLNSNEAVTLSKCSLTKLWLYKSQRSPVLIHTPVLAQEWWDNTKLWNQSQVQLDLS